MTLDQDVPPFDVAEATEFFKEGVKVTKAAVLGHFRHRMTKKSETGSKQARVIAMLRSPAGATIATVMKTTGWQQHSVRGFLAGVVRKRLKLKLGSSKVNGNRVYRITSADGGKPTTVFDHHGSIPVAVLLARVRPKRVKLCESSGE
jgi:hypothetical protein